MDDVPIYVPNKSIKFLDQLRAFIRFRQLSYATEKTYIHWVKRFIYFHGKRHPLELGTEVLERFLTHLSTRRAASVNTQNVVLNALIFMYREFLQKPIKDLNYSYAKPTQRIPTVLSHTETCQIVSKLDGIYHLIFSLLYGVRIAECLNLRILDIDFEVTALFVRAGKGRKDRTTLLPASQVEQRRNQINYVTMLHKQDLQNGFGEVYLPYALTKKSPNVAKELKWQFLFPASKVVQDPRSGILRQHHLHPSAISKSLKRVVRKWLAHCGQGGCG
ncbi:MAG: phage integrase N-terminal SAM-like domain-containing protein [Proteobacteria bacterium]|nr:phage integrase N-terminal SAM-like domain-containing protein [Pseudomonadota bacterium]